MRHSSQLTLLGAKAYNDSIEGTAHDFTKLFAVMSVSESSGIGFATVELKWGDSKNMDKLKGLQFPLNVTALIEQVTTGTRITTIIRDLDLKTIKPAVFEQT
ncbi:MAG: hypothetical protein VXY56_05580 [Pseudomonadota bacterium]|nr:hypothetical protein [Pseudomonadota bacterium]